MSSTPTVFDPTRVVDGHRALRRPDPALPARAPTRSPWPAVRRRPPNLAPVKTLVIGTGGREHALARALAGDPGVTEVHAAPGNPGWPRSRRCTTSTRWTGRGRRARRLARRRPGRGRPGGAAGRRRGRRGAHRRDRGVRPVGEAARLEGSKAFAKEVMDAAGVPTAGRSSAARPRRPPPRWTSSGAPYVVKDDGLAAGKGVVVTDDRDEALAHAARLRAWCGDRGVPRRARGLAVRDHRRHHGLPAPAGPGLQADPRRRRGAQHRRHGCLHAAALGAARPGRRGARDRAAADRRRAGPARHAVRGAALRRPRAHLARRAGGRVQRPLRRPGDPAAAGAARVAARRAAHGRRHRQPRRRAAAGLRRRRRGRCGHGQPRLPRLVVLRRRDHRHRRGRGAAGRAGLPRRHGAARR